MTITIASSSAAMDGGFTGIADVSAALATVHARDAWRVIGGVAVMLHIQRLRLDVPLRATADADLGVVPSLLREAALVAPSKRAATAGSAAIGGSDGSTGAVPPRSTS